MQIGKQMTIPCLNCDCSGNLHGAYGGKFKVGQTRIEYTQVLDCQCDRCGLELTEAFEVWNEQNQEYWISDRINIPLTDESDLSVLGLGRPAATIGPQMSYFLKYGQRL